MDAEFDQLKREFLAEADGKVREMDSLLAGQLSPQAVERVIYLAHQLKGSGGSYGFSTISVEAAALEKALEKRGKRAPKDGEPDLRGRVGQLQEEIRARLDELSARTS